MSYRYDANGNLTEDTHKALTFQYNYLNLPELISETGGSGQIELVYDASGRKLIKRGPDGDREYILGIEYLDGKLESIAAPDGRLVAQYDTVAGVTLEGFRAEYWRKDHLGNTRLTFSDLDSDGVITFRAGPLEIMQEDHYYPFGMGQVGDWYATVDPENKYTYNAKELNTELDLNWLDYGARYYDPALGRFTGVDPIADQFPHVSTYNYAENEPIRHIDLHGLQRYDPQTGQSGPWTSDYLKKGAQGVLFHTAYTGIRSAQIRQQYHNKVASLDPGDSAGRTKAKVESRAKTPAITRAIVENMRPMSEEGTRTGGTANKSNIKVNKDAGNLGKIGKAAGAIGVGISVYNVATAEDKSKAIAEEGGSMLGAVAVGEAGATLGASIGVWFGGAGAVPGAIIGGLIGGMIGGIAGKEAGEAVHNAIVNEKKEEQK